MTYREIIIDTTTAQTALKALADQIASIDGDSNEYRRATRTTFDRPGLVAAKDALQAAFNS